MENTEDYDFLGIEFMDSSWVVLVTKRQIFGTGKSAPGVERVGSRTESSDPDHCAPKKNNRKSVTSTRGNTFKKAHSKIVNGTKPTDGKVCGREICGSSRRSARPKASACAE